MQEDCELRCNPHNAPEAREASLSNIENSHSGGRSQANERWLHYGAILLTVFSVTREILRALRRARLPPREPFSDPVLGTFDPCEDGWIAKMVCGGDSFELHVRGECEPDPAVLAHAREIVNDFSSFKKLVMDRLEVESRGYPPDGKAELAGLEIDQISLRGPGEGMIFFRGSPSDISLWRFDYIGGEPTGLGCDT